MRVFCTTLLLISLFSIQSNAQAPGSAEAHVAAAKAVAASAPKDAKNELDYDYMRHITVREETVA